MTAVEIGAQHIDQDDASSIHGCHGAGACMVDSAVNRDELWVQSRSGASDSIRKGNAEAGFALASGLAKAKDLHPQVEISGPSSPSGQQ